jgi:hypothetical protein
MNTTVGQVIAALFDRYQRLYGDDHLAALVIQDHVNEALRRRARAATAHASSRASRAR